MRKTILASVVLIGFIACNAVSPPDEPLASSAKSTGAAQTNRDANDASGGAGASGASSDAASNSMPNGSVDAGATDSGSTGNDGGRNPGSADSGGADSGSDSSDSGGGSNPGPSGPSIDPGPQPSAPCTITKDQNGFFTRNSSQGSYVAYVPASYSSDTPMRLIVGLHGCGDNAANFASWAINPYSTRATQQYIGIAIDGATGGSSCWNQGADDPKVLAAIDDISQCFWVDQKKITIAGYSSGGIMAYRLGLSNASFYAGILIENSDVTQSGEASTLIAGASRKIPIAHVAHQDDTDFPLAEVQSDWTKLQAAGFPLTTKVVAGDHNGTTTDWSDTLIPAAAGWAAP